MSRVAREPASDAPGVVVAAGGVFHAYHLARSVHRSQRLRRFVTIRFDRRETGIPTDRVVEIPWPGRVARLLQRVPSATTQILSYYVGDAWFDRTAARYAAGADLYHAFAQYGLCSMRVARRAGAVTAVDCASAHPVLQHALLREEFHRLGYGYPALARRIVARGIRELAEADWVVVCSEFVRRSMVAHGVPAAKLRMVPLGFSPDRFRPAAKSDDVFRAIFVGPLSAQKGVPYLLEGFRRASLPPERSELLLVGEPWPESRAFLPQYEGLYRRVPFMPQADLVRAYQSASVMVLPSIQDGFGMVVLEAGACGVPVIVSENVGAPIRNGEHGFVVPIRDADAIAERLVFLFQHEAVRRDMAAGVRRHVAQFTWERYHEEIDRHHREMLETRAARGPNPRSRPR